jgi:hypothetical protein
VGKFDDVANITCDDFAIIDGNLVCYEVNKQVINTKALKIKRAFASHYWKDVTTEKQ